MHWYYILFNYSIFILNRRFRFRLIHDKFHTDLDECELSGVCPVTATCINTLGGFHCNCGPDTKWNYNVVPYLIFDLSSDVMLSLIHMNILLLLLLLLQIVHSSTLPHLELFRLRIYPWWVSFRLKNISKDKSGKIKLISIEIQCRWIFMYWTLRYEDQWKLWSYASEVNK